MATNTRIETGELDHIYLNTTSENPSDAVIITEADVQATKRGLINTLAIALLGGCVAGKSK